LYTVTTVSRSNPSETQPRGSTKVSIAKGLLFVEEKIARARAYYVQYTSEEDRTFAIDYVIRPPGRSFRQGQG